MAKHSFSKLLLLFTLSASLVSAKERKSRPEVNIGRFKIPFNDPEIEERVVDVAGNITAWDDIWFMTDDAWWEREDLLSQNETIDVLYKLGNDSKVSDDDMEKIIQKSKENYDTVLKETGMDPAALWNETFIDFADRFLQTAIDELYPLLQQRKYSSYGGVGANVTCKRWIDEILKDASEWDKAGMSAATTLMALLPTFLAFGNL